MKNLIFKFFVWRIKIKIEKLGDEEKAKFLLNELIKAVQNSGKSFVSNNDKSFGAASVWIHNAGTERAKVVIENNVKGWSISTKPNFELMGDKF